MPSLAADTRAAARRHPFLLAALRAGVVNYTAAARFLADEIGGGGTDSVVTALRRLADDLPAYEETAVDARVTMRGGVGPADDPADTLLSVGGEGFAADSGSLTAIVAEGEAGTRALAAVLSRLDAREIEAVAAGAAADGLAVVVDRRSAADALRTVEDALSAVPA